MTFTVHRVQTKLEWNEELKRRLPHFQHKATSIAYPCTALHRCYRLAKRAPLLRNYVIKYLGIIYSWSEFH